MQLVLFQPNEIPGVAAFPTQLLKWVGNKQRFAREILSFFPSTFGTYYEPFLGSGGVLGTLAPERALASDSFGPLMAIWQTLKEDPETLKRWYAERYEFFKQGDKRTQYEALKTSYNRNPNGADLLFLCRSCYGGVVRFRKADGHMSTPVGAHEPITPRSFARRVDLWTTRMQGTEFAQLDYAEAMELAQSGDAVYCDPPYHHSQTIIYGAQDFDLRHLFEVIVDCKRRGVFVALSIDGTKRSGDHLCDVPVPPGLFEREAFVNCGRSMLKRFQMNGRTLERHEVADRLLLTH